MVGDGDAVGVAAEVSVDLLGASEGRLRVDVPARAEESLAEAHELAGRREFVGQAKLSVPFGFGESSVEFSAIEAGEDGDRKQVSASGRYPSLAVRGEPPAGNDAVQVGMEPEIPGPCVEHSSEADLGAKPARVRGELGERGPGSLEEDLEAQGAVRHDQRPQLTRQCEDHMEVVGRQDALAALFEPSRLLERLTLGTVAVPAGVVRGSFVPAPRAQIEMPTESRRPAGLDGSHRRALSRRQPVHGPVRLPVGSENLCHLVRRASGMRRSTTAVARHRSYPSASPSLVPRRSSGLLVLATCRLLTWA